MNKLRLYWGVDGSFTFRLTIAPEYKAAPFNGTLLGASLRFTLGLPGYTSAPIIDSSSPTLLTHSADELVGYFDIPAAALTAALTDGEKRYDLAGQLDLTPANGPKGEPYQIRTVVYPAA
ncbi:MAG: hypothetical protein ACFB0C_19555 [Leptolyngbyaceae cyanobacterium]